jgi:multicomponent Na+:H+ antiporter subunit D
MAAHATVLADWVIVLPVVLCLLGAAALLAARTVAGVQSWGCAAVLLAVLACDGTLVGRVLADGPVAMTMGNWLPPFGISFTADLMGAGFATLAAFVALAVVLYLAGDAPESARRDGLYQLILLLLAGVSGAFLTGDLFNLYVWFEVMLIASFGLIVLAGNPLQLDAAVKYGVLNFLATTLFLAALGLLYGLLGTLNMADIVGAAARADLAPMTAIAALLALAFGIKAAVFPVNAWLPAAYHAPPPAISALMGGLLTKVAVYALLRVMVMLLPGPREVLGSGLAAIGLATMLLGPLGAIAETGLRRAIGFMLIGGIGIVVLAVPSADATVVSGAIVYVAHAMLTLAALYLAAGLLERLTGETDTRRMGGVYAASAPLSLIVLALLLAAAGVPPFLGFWPKFVLLRGFVAAGDWIAVSALLLNAFLTLIAGARLWMRIFWRSGVPRGRVHPQGSGAVALLGGTVLLLGLWPNLLLAPATLAARDVLAPSRYIAATGLSP